MKCNNFFCVDYDKGFTQGNCARHILGDTNDCSQRKAFQRLKNRATGKMGESGQYILALHRNLNRIKKELEGQK